jgi:hypothetical protein
MIALGEIGHTRWKASRLLAALLITWLGVALLVGQAQVRRFEAAASARLVGSLGIVSAHALGTAVVFHLGSGFFGYVLTPGCTVAFLISPFFFLLAAALVAAPRIAVRRALMTLAIISVLLFVVNQLRLVVFAASMRAWGFKTGYERSHVFLGTIASTLGLVAALLLFLAVLSGGRRPRPTVDPDES